MGGDLNSSGRAISYECFVDQNVDGFVDETTGCSSLMGLNFNSATGLLSGTIKSGFGGLHEIKIKATSDGLSDEEFFTLTVHSLDSLTVTLAKNEIRTGESTTASAVGIYSNGWVQSMTTQVSWSSSKTSVAATTSSTITSQW